MKRKLQAKEGVRLTIVNKGMMLLRFAALSAVASSFTQVSPYFSDSEKQHIAAFWNSSGRYEIQPVSDAATKGPWQVRLTPEGSSWLWKYNSIRGLGKSASGSVQPAQNNEQKSWESWIDDRISYDRWLAGQAVAEANSRFTGKSVPNPCGGEMSDPGPQPAGLMKLVGIAPSFAAAVAPSQYTVKFDDGTSLTLNDNPQMKPRYAYYRFPQGVRSSGTPVKQMPQSEVDSLFNAAGIAPSVQRVMKAVSMLEGGFDSINTYDTGFVSVGLIQFACLQKGAGSLGSVLLREKQEDPAAFREDFHKYGIDVAQDGSLVALNVDSGAVSEGTAAARTIISDKRLIAVFQHAGQRSPAFRIAQLKVAKEQYYPSEDTITVQAAGQLVTTRVGDIIRSEAGMATLMDRKVNTGKIDPLPSIVTQIAAQTGARSIEEIAMHEKEIISALKFRKDYTQDSDLSQPGAYSLRQRSSEITSRHLPRGGRGGKHSK